MWIGVGVIAVVGYMLWKKQQDKKAQAAKLAAAKAKTTPTELRNVPDKPVGDLATGTVSTSGKLRTV